MTAKEYQKLAMRTNDGKCTERMDNWKISAMCNGDNAGALLNGCLGLAGEAGEVLDIVKKWIFHCDSLNVENLHKELGDVMWYVAMICDSMQISIEDVMEKNIEKLKMRYPEGFDIDKANNRQKDDL